MDHEDDVRAGDSKERMAEHRPRVEAPHDAVIRARYEALAAVIAEVGGPLRPLDRHLCALALVAGELDRSTPTLCERARQRPRRRRGLGAMRLALGHGTLAALGNGHGVSPASEIVIDSDGRERVRAVSRITDHEMWEINVESSALMAWLLHPQREWLFRKMVELESRYPELETVDVGAGRMPAASFGEALRWELFRKTVEAVSPRNHARADVEEWLGALATNAAPQWAVLAEADMEAGYQLPPRDEANLLINLCYRNNGDRVERLHAGVHREAALEHGRARFTPGELAQILEAAGEACGEQLALAWSAPLRRFLSERSLLWYFPWTWDRQRLYVPVNEPLPPPPPTVPDPRRLATQIALRAWSDQFGGAVPW